MMTQRLVEALCALLAEPTGNTAVHFHSDGLHGEVAACYDRRCSRPSLDVG